MSTEPRAQSAASPTTRCQPATNRSPLGPRDYRPRLQVPPSRVIRYHSSSGKTGRPTVMAYTRSDLALLGKLTARAFQPLLGRLSTWTCYNGFGNGLFAGGLSPEEAIANGLLSNNSLFSAGLAFGQAAQWLEQNSQQRLNFAPALRAVSILDKKVLAEHRDLIEVYQPNIFLGTPSLAFALLEIGVLHKFKAVIIGGEPSSQSLRTLLSLNDQLTVIEVYGLSEGLGPGVAQSCNLGRLHLNEDVFDAHISSSELVLSSTAIEAITLNNHRTGDIVRELSCSCSNPHRAIEVLGRQRDKIAALECYPSQLEQELVNHGLSPCFRVTQTEVIAEPRLTGAHHPQLDLQLPLRLVAPQTLARTLCAYRIET